MIAKEKTKQLERINTPPTEILLSKGSLLRNLKEFQKLSPLVAPVIKNNAFGHGLVEVASILEPEDLPFFIVDSYEEALMLRGHGFNTPILIIGFVSSKTINSSNLDGISYTITSFESLIDLCSNIKKDLKVHFKIDTGMSRQGIIVDQIEEATYLIEKSPHLIVEGVCSHLADADNVDTKFTDQQIVIWNDHVELFIKKFPAIKYYHLSNTAGHGHLAKAKFNLSRPGVGLYGFTGNGQVDSLVVLEPIMTVKSIITGTKLIPKDTKVGYNGKFISTSEIKIATIPIGYGAGFDRRLSNKGCVKIGQNFARILGRVSMNITIIDISNIKDIKLNTPVTVISNIESDKNSIVNIAKICETIPHDISTGISPLIKRRIIE